MKALAWIGIGWGIALMAVSVVFSGYDKTYDQAVCQQFCSNKGANYVNCNHVLPGKCVCSFTQPATSIKFEEPTK